MAVEERQGSWRFHLDRDDKAVKDNKLNGRKSGIELKRGEKKEER